MKGYWRHATGIGYARVIMISGSWCACIGGENLGQYPTPQQAVDDLVGGHTWVHSSGVDTSTLGLPIDVGDWELVPVRGGKKTGSSGECVRVGEMKKLTQG